MLVTAADIWSELIAARLAPSPTTEALAVLTSFKTYLSQPTHRRLPSVDQSSLNLAADGHARDGISLKLALFNLQKYIGEEDFVADFVSKGGVKMLVRLMAADGGLSGNSLAVCPRHSAHVHVSRAHQ